MLFPARTIFHAIAGQQDKNGCTTRYYFRLVSNDTKADFGYFVITNAGGIRCWTNDSPIGFKRNL